jgi:hypothetical protein
MNYGVLRTVFSASKHLEALARRAKCFIGSTGSRRMVEAFSWSEGTPLPLREAIGFV